MKDSKDSVIRDSRSETMTNTLSVIVPCYNESEMIYSFYDSLKRVLEGLKGFEYEIIFVDDGSSDDTFAKLSQIFRQNARVTVCSLSRNFGHQIALSAGLDRARGNVVIMMDADLQHPPCLIPEMIDKWRDGYDVVSAVRKHTEDVSFCKHWTSKGFYFLFNKLSSTHIPEGAADFCLLDRQAFMTLRAMPERHRFLRGMISWMGFRRAYLPYEAPKRPAGRSKYNMWKMINLATEAILSFSALPLLVAVRIGLVITLLGFVYLAWILGRFLILRDLVPGWSSLICVILIIGGFQIMLVGLIGQYLARLFDEVKGRPLYLTKAELGCTQEMEDNHSGAAND